MNYVEKNDSSSLDHEQWFHTLATHYVESQIYFHLNQCGVFQHLNRNGTHIGSIAGDLGLSEYILGVLLEYVSNVGELITKTGNDSYAMTAFGSSVLNRYGRRTGGQYQYNIFDVRVGSWGPVWENLGNLLGQKMIYGKDIHRRGDLASEGVYKIAAPLAPVIEKAAREIGAKAIVEIGPTSGVLGEIARHDPSIRCIGIDIKQESLDDARERAEVDGVSDVIWLKGDLFRAQEWLDKLPCDGPVLFFSFHIHEFLARGTDDVVEALRTITSWPKTGGVLAVEQPKIEDHKRESTHPVQWLYSQSHVLTHHVIKNGQIFTSDQWRDLLLVGGCSRVEQSPSPCFGFKAFMGHIDRG